MAVAAALFSTIRQSGRALTARLFVCSALKFSQTLLIKTHIQQEHNAEQRKVAGYSDKVGLHIVEMNS